MLARTSSQHPLVRLALCFVALGLALGIWSSLPAARPARAQDADNQANTPEPEAGAAGDARAGRIDATAPTVDKSLNLWQLTVAGGIFMIPIAGMSILAVTMGIERMLALRSQRVLPAALVKGLGELAAGTRGFDPRQAYRLCQQYPSAAASVVRVMLLRAGRSVPEIESAVAQASQREADRLYANVRWLNLAASLSTMLGLIGTIQGMILAFHDLTSMDAAADRTTVLAKGIYTALVTTFAGLTVAIPALLASHFLEGRILHAFRQIDELVFSLLPQLERYEGRVRFSQQDGNGDLAKLPAAEPSEAGER